MTQTKLGNCATVGLMPTVRVNLDLDPTAVRIAEMSAELQNVTVEAWISKALRDQAMAQAAKTMNERGPEPDDLVEWTEMVEDVIFGEVRA